ncbi:MAG: extracellular solute-binding protein [Spirochaetales bacterium]
MKKMVISLLVLSVLGFALNAEQVTLKVLNYIDATQAGYADDKAIWDAFAKANPDIDLVKEELFNEPFHQKTEAYIAAGQLPDVLFAWPSGRSASLHTKNLLKDLKPLLGSDLNNFVPAAVNPANQSGNKLAILPQSVTYTTAMYANVALLKANGLAVPKTYAELKAMVPKLKAKGIQTVLMANKDTWVMQSCLFSTVSGRMAGNAFIDSVIKGNAKFTDKPFVDALTFIATLYKDGVLSKDTIQTGYGEVPQLFADGKAAFLIDGDWRVGAFLTDKASGKALIAPAAQKSDFEIISFPSIPGEKNPGLISAIVGTGYGISTNVAAGSAVEKAAVKLVQYLYSPAVQKVRLETGAYIPSRKNVTSDKIEPLSGKLAAYYGKIPVTGYVLDGVIDGDNAPVVEVLNNGLQEIGIGTKTPAEVAAAMQAKVIAKK